MPWLKDLLKQKGVTAASCAQAIGMTRPTFQRVLLDPQRLNAIEIEKLAEHLSLQPEYLFQLIIQYYKLNNATGVI